jgi:hypothetical protein
MKRLTPLFAVLGMVLALASTAQAQLAITNTPQDGHVGPYRLIFYTLDKTQTINTNINYYNVWVSYKAAEVPKLREFTNATWKAIVSTETVDARDNTETNPYNPEHESWPIYNLNGIRVADHNFDLWTRGQGEPLDARITTEWGSLTFPRNESYASIATGTARDGTAYTNSTVYDGYPNAWLGNYPGTNGPNGDGNRHVMRAYQHLVNGDPNSSWIQGQEAYSPHLECLMALSSVLGGGPSGTRVAIE